MPSLTDRYVFTVLRHIPEPQRADLDKELRSSIADLVDAHVGSGATQGEAEDLALRELGDPDRFAAGVTNRPQHLIGPESFPSWWRLLRFLLALITPIAAVAHALVLVATGEVIGTVIAGLITTAFGVSIQIAFWVTLVFVILERTENPRHPNWQAQWTPDQLPEYAHDRRTAGDLAAELVWIGILAALLLGQQFWSFSVLQGERVPVLAPAEWSFWWPYLLVILALDAAFAIWVWRRGWSWLAAGINVLLGLAGAIPLIWLALEQRIWNPEFFSSLNWTPTEFGTTDVITAATVTVVLGIFIWDSVDGILKARRAQTGAPSKVSGTGVRV
ncbi:hypothetical protein B0I08_10431 [Glaciihabitans tibetensis]|uniref:Uncharacterized protein n=1 Tax=Glaciihabitans tibetensis TaxID=1266600 RepID=A0A2T0VDS3_9MICO|nr:permease prefix domain 1-containing protein [Glaciihabitans tibetensis]PRY68329.1 hypothetical protein B0I08_10431 [Glaciihabitans tibetensis]